MVLHGSSALRETYPRRIDARAYVSIPIPVWSLAFAAGVLIALPSYDPLLTFSCIAVLPMLAVLTWRVGEPPVAFAALVAQWLQISAGTFRATASGLDLNDLLKTAGANYATWLSLAGLLVLAIGIRFPNLHIAPMNTDALRSELSSYRYSRVLAAYGLVQCANLLLGGMAWYIPGLAQALLAATNVRWLFFFLLAVTTLVQKRHYGFLAAATVFEIILGFTSFFADFRVVFFVLAVSYLMVQPRIRVRMIAWITLLSCAVLCLAVIWSAVKEDYRTYQNQGTGAQISRVGTPNKLETLSQLVANINTEQFLDGFNKLVERVEYIQYFGLVTENVPSFLPYDDGSIWGAAIYHVVTPRLLFPDKAELTPDRENTVRYTGLSFAGGGEQTEIPLGYMAESYIDFGPIGMFLPIFLLGLLLGYEYRYFITRRRFVVFASGLAPVVFITAASFETTAIKILGGNLTTFIVCYLAFRFVIPILQPWMINSGRT